MKYFVYIFFFISLPLYSFGNNEKIENFTDLGKMAVTVDHKYYEITLPYFKEYGIDKITTKDSVAIVIYELLVDGNVCRPKNQYFSNNEAITKIYEENSETEEKFCYLKMNWFISGGILTLNAIKKGIYFESLTGKNKISQMYNIRYGSQEIFLTYAIRFPNATISKKVTVRWEIEWP